MKITLDNYPTAAVNANTSDLSPEQLGLHKLLLEFGSELTDDDDTTRREAQLLVDLLNGNSGGSQAPAPARKPTTPRTPKPAAAKKPAATPRTRKPAAAKQPAAAKAEKTTRAAKAKPAPAGGNVRGITTAVALIRGFVGLLDKSVPGSRIDAKLRAVQQAMLDGHVTKQTAHAKDVDQVQDLLLKAVSKMGTSAKPTEMVTLTLGDEALRGKLIGIAGGEQQYESVAVLRAFVRLSGKKATQAQLTNLLRRTASPKIKDSDPFGDELRAIHDALKKAKPDAVLNQAPVGLSGVHRDRLSSLAGLVRTIDRHTARPRRASRPAAAPKKKVLRPAANRKRPSASRRKKAQAQ